MKRDSYTLTAEVWIYPGDAAWHFVNIERGVSEKIQKKYSGPRRGFGAVAVEVQVGESVWNTSLFPDKRSGTYLLPIKKEIRKKEGIYDSDKIEVTIKVL